MNKTPSENGSGNSAKDLMGSFADYILIQLSYSNKIILPINQGLEFLKILSGAYRFETPDSSYDPIKTFNKFEPYEINFQVQFMTEKQVNKARMAGCLEVPDDD